VLPTTIKPLLYWRHWCIALLCEINTLQLTNQYIGNGPVRKKSSQQAGKQAGFEAEWNPECFGLILS